VGKEPDTPKLQALNMAQTILTEISMVLFSLARKSNGKFKQGM
jgi:hypothetical protein